MTDIEKTLDYFRKHENRLNKEVHRFLWKYATCPYQVDLYFYPDTKEFYAFVNLGGNSWLDDNHITIYSCNGEFLEIEKGRFREYINETTEMAICHIFDKLTEIVECDRKKVLE